VRLVEISLGTRPTEVRARLQRLQEEGASHWLLRGLARSRTVYASRAESDGLREWLATGGAPLSVRRQISNALVVSPVELRADWRAERPPRIVVTLAGRTFGEVGYRPGSPGWAARFAAKGGASIQITVESLSAYDPDDFEADIRLREAALDTALQVAISHLAHRPLHVPTQAVDA
jgi:hypothetical protein